MFANETLAERRKPQTFRGAISTLRRLRGTILAMLAVACIGSFAGRMTYSFLVIYCDNVIGLTKTQWGLLQTATMAVSTPLFLFGGMLADRFGRVPCILVARSLFPLDLLALLFLRNYNQLLTVHLLLGVGGGLGGGGLRGGGYMGGPSWQALVADAVPSKDRGKVMGLMATVTGTLGLPAPMLGAYLWEAYSPDLLLSLGAVIALTSMPIIFKYVKESKTRER